MAEPRAFLEFTSTSYKRARYITSTSFPGVYESIVVDRFSEIIYKSLLMSITSSVHSDQNINGRMPKQSK